MRAQAVDRDHMAARESTVQDWFAVQLEVGAVQLCRRGNEHSRFCLQVTQRLLAAETQRMKVLEAQSNPSALKDAFGDSRRQQA